MLLIKSVNGDVPQLVHERTVKESWPYCPQCYRIVDPEFSRHCRCCGQALTWRGSSKYAEYISGEEAIRRREIICARYDAWRWAEEKRIDRAGIDLDK